MKILVLMGGDSPERDVSLVSGEAVTEALRQAGHQVLAVDTADSWKALPGQTEHLAHGIGANPPDPQELQKIDSERALKSFESSDLKEVEVIFLALHGGKGEDGRIQALLDLTGKPYTGSGVLASALAMDKNMSKKIFEREGILTPRWVYWDSQNSVDFSTFKTESSKLGYPQVVKPNNQGSTVGVSVIDNDSQFEEAIETAKGFSNQIIVEEFIPGREITVAVLDNQPLPVVEIVPEHGIYDYECKYTSGKSKYICPPELTSQETEEVQRAGLKAFQALGCDSYARVDFRMSPEGKFYCLEVNTLPGMTEHSLVPKAAKAAGISFSGLVDRIARLALENRKQR
jgi:D-alanine-D-alanine ligase